jgi:BirA family transcriptional regulator, biotin operon repressor / biotin---[acetyl-CoA-carboxylase] ligase
MPPDAATWADRGVLRQLRGTRFSDLRWFDRIDSTNTYVLAAARRGVPEGLVVVADEQTAGRGRLGRRWESPPGASLLVSVLARPTLPSDQRVTMATATALADAVETVAGFSPGLKWPNDLVVSDRKLAGILAESDGAAVVVGAGCNVNWGEIPEGLSNIATACDLEAGRTVDRTELLVRFLHELDHVLDDLDSVVARYRARLVTIGRHVRVEHFDGELHGEAVDVEEDGALVVSTDDGSRVSVRLGDVVHLRSV